MNNVSRDGMIRVLRRSAAFAAALVLAGTVAAHESEQFTLPAGREFADLGPHFSRIVYQAVVDAANSTNAAIRTAIEAGKPQGEIDALRSPEAISTATWQHLFAAIPTNELLDAGLLSAGIRSQYPGLVTMHRPVQSIYDDPLLVLDISKSVRTFFRAGTVNVDGTLIGTDKIIHFINIGRIYHGKYISRRARGMSDADASLSSIRSTERNPLLSEDGVLGWFTTGIRSNGDLAADYAGLKFYINLTEEVRIGSRTLPPMLVRDGDTWRVQLAPDADVFSAFVTPHWNEALNPSKYVKYIGNRLKTLVRQRCEDVLDWYAISGYGNPMTRDQFEAIETELSTYYGEPYGFLSNGNSRVAVATVCFDRAPAGAQTASAAGAGDMARTPLWWAARAGHPDEIARLAAGGANPNAADLDGETAVHAAVRSGNPAAVKAVLAQGGDPARSALYGVTPLQLAVAGGHLEAASILLQAGAQPDARDIFGKTALHDAAIRRSVALTDLLLAHGADPSATDDAGTSVLHVAAAAGHDPLASALVARGASLRARNATGSTPADLATREGHAQLARALMPTSVAETMTATGSADSQRR